MQAPPNKFHYITTGLNNECMVIVHNSHPSTNRDGKATSFMRGVGCTTVARRCVLVPIIIVLLCCCVVLHPILLAYLKRWTRTTALPKRYSSTQYMCTTIPRMHFVVFFAVDWHVFLSFYCLLHRTLKQRAEGDVIRRCVCTLYDVTHVEPLQKKQTAKIKILFCFVCQFCVNSRQRHTRRQAPKEESGNTGQYIGRRRTGGRVLLYTGATCSFFLTSSCFALAGQTNTPGLRLLYWLLFLLARR